jgi:hypothetical protein
LTKYFVKNWIGCHEVLEFDVIPIEYDDEDNGPYGQIDTGIRNWINNQNLGERRALFPMEMWNMWNTDTFNRLGHIQQVRCDRLGVIWLLTIKC